MRVDVNVRARDRHACDATVNPRTVTSRAASSARARAGRQRRHADRRATKIAAPYNNLKTPDF